MKILTNKIKNNKAIVGIIGLGYVGLPRAIQFCEKKIKVIGFDNDHIKIQKIKNKQSYLTDVKKSTLKKKIIRQNLNVTNDFSYIRKVDIIIICLPTPLKKNLTPDLSYIKDTFNNIKKYLLPNQLLCLESTSYPGTTIEIFEKFLKKNFILGQNFFLGYSPERNDPGQKKYPIRHIPKIVSGLTDNCLKIVNSIYGKIFVKTVKVKSIEVAEITKLYENIYRAVNIGFVNEMKKICSEMKLPIDEIIQAAKTKPFGFNAFYPGPGLGGHCIPIDPFYLTWRAKKFNISTEFINLAGKINRSMPKWVVKFLENHSKDNIKKILILGIAYKKNVNDSRESPAFEIIKILKSKGYNVSYSDPYIPKIPKLRSFNFLGMKSLTISKKNLKSFDAIILVTDHDNFNYKLIQKNSKLIIDTRHRFDKEKNNVYYS